MEMVVRCHGDGCSLSWRWLCHLSPKYDPAETAVFELQLTNGAFQLN